MRERMGLGRMEFAVRSEGGTAVYESTRSTFAGFPVPKLLGLEARGIVAPTQDGWSVEVNITSPLLGLLCSYRAVMTWK